MRVDDLFDKVVECVGVDESVVEGLLEREDHDGRLEGRGRERVLAGGLAADYDQHLLVFS